MTIRRFGISSICWRSSDYLCFGKEACPCGAGLQVEQLHSYFDGHTHYRIIIRRVEGNCCFNKPHYPTKGHRGCGLESRLFPFPFSGFRPSDWQKQICSTINCSHKGFSSSIIFLLNRKQVVSCHLQPLPSFHIFWTSCSKFSTFQCRSRCPFLHIH